MTIDSAPADSSPEASRSPAPPSWPWRRAALFLAGAAQLITISALLSADPIAVNWASLLLAVAPAPLAAAAAFARPRLTCRRRWPGSRSWLRGSPGSSPCGCRELGCGVTWGLPLAGRA
jgi:hypothetical protein